MLLIDDFAGEGIDDRVTEVSAAVRVPRDGDFDKESLLVVCGVRSD